jgi:hypothetical protein
VHPTSILFSREGAKPFLCAVILWLSGCSSRYVYEDFEAKYQAPEVPTQFATGSRGWRVAGHFSYNNQGVMDIARRDTMWTGQYGNTAYFHREDVPVGRLDSFRVVDERYRFDRSAGLLGLMGIYQGRHWFAGATGGAALPGPKRNYFGIFGGYTQFIGGGRWAPLASGGVIFNKIDVAGRGWSNMDQLYLGEGSPPPGEYYPQADTTSISDWEVPMKFGILYRAHPAFQPYLLFYGNTISTWPRESDDKGRFDVDESGISLGIRSEAYRDLILSLEGAMMDYSGPMSYENNGVKLTFSVEYAFGS